MPVSPTSYAHVLKDFYYNSNCTEDQRRVIDHALFDLLREELIDAVMKDDSVLPDSIKQAIDDPTDRDEIQSALIDTMFAEHNSELLELTLKELER